MLVGPHLANKFPLFYVIQKFLTVLHKIPPLVPVLSQMNVLHNFPVFCFNPLNPELNLICYLLALLGVHHFLHVSRIGVKLLTFRLIMSYIYIWSTHS